MFTKEQMEKLLELNGWKYTEGWAMGYGAPESDNIIISKEEVMKWIFTVPQKYWWKDNMDEQMYDTEQAFDYLFDDFGDENDTNESIEEKLKIELQKKYDCQCDYCKNHVCFVNHEGTRCMDAMCENNK